MGSTQFKTPRANWDKRCCSNSRGPVVEIPDDVSEEDANKINKQIARMPNLKQVCTLRPNSPAPLTDDWKVTDDSSVNFHDVFFFIFCQIIAKNEEKHVMEIYG